MSKLCKRLWDKSTSIQKVKGMDAKDRKELYALLDKIYIKLNDIPHSEDVTSAICAYNELEFYINNAFNKADKLGKNNDKA